MSHITSFIQRINSQLFEGKGEEQLHLIWKEVTTMNRCQMLIRTGDRAGQVCNKGCVTDTNTCMCHQPRVKKEKNKNKNNENERCGAIVPKGTCRRFCVDGQDMCKRHIEVNMKLCFIVIEKGKRKGMVCGTKTVKGKETCTRHISIMKDMPPLEYDYTHEIKDEAIDNETT
jgi:hypothetical protein